MQKLHIRLSVEVDVPDKLFKKIVDAHNNGKIGLWMLPKSKTLLIGIQQSQFLTGMKVDISRPNGLHTMQLRADFMMRMNMV